MNSSGLEIQPEPSREELMAMAYVDGELVPEQRREFELLLARRADLTLAVAQFERLAVMARQCVPPEPLDAQWRALDADPSQRVLLGLGRALMGLGLAVGLVWLVLELAQSSIAPVCKLALGSLAVGFALLVVAFLRARARLRALDPYTDIER